MESQPKVILRLLKVFEGMVTRFQEVAMVLLCYGQCTWGVAARIKQLGLKLKDRNGEKIPITTSRELLKTRWQPLQFWVGKQALFQELKLLSHLSVTVMGPLILIVMCLLSRRSIQIIHFWYVDEDGFLR